jgi:tRNA(adenine34) deaminase
MLTLKPMECAFSEAEKAFSQEEVPVGAVIVDSLSGKIIASAHNEMVTRKDPTAHAELLAIQQACLVKESGRLEDCDIYVTLEPCPMCAQAMSFARLRRLYFGAYDPKGGGVDHGARIFNASSCHHIPEVIGGVEEQKCGQILKDFFENVRRKETPHNLSNQENRS